MNFFITVFASCRTPSPLGGGTPNPGRVGFAPTGWGFKRSVPSTSEGSSMKALPLRRLYARPHRSTHTHGGTHMTLRMPADKRGTK